MTRLRKIPSVAFCFSIISLSLCCNAAFAADMPAIPIFQDETASAGITSLYQGDWQYMAGGGIAAFDCNDDGFPDLAFAGGEGIASLYVNKSARGGALKFEKRESGLELANVTGLYPLDIDGDGIMDLVVLRVGETVLMRGQGKCKFTRANEAWNFNGGDAWWTAFSATWEKGAQWPTIALGSYIDRKFENEPWGHCTDNKLYRPRSDGGFADPVALTPSYCTLSMLFTDWNLSGVQSLRVSNDREYYEGGQEQMWHVEAGQPPRLYTDAEGWKFLKIWGMGIASTYLAGDMYPSYFLTSMSDNKLQLLRNPAASPPKADYKDVAFDHGAVAYRPYTGDDLRPSTGWHAQFEDVNNDGLADLFVAKGNVDRMPDFAEKDPDNLMLQTPDRKFHEVGDKAGITNFSPARGGALVDLNLDGKLDLVVSHRRENIKIWRNMSDGLGHFIALRLHSDGGNRDAIGAKIEVKTADRVQKREITSGGGHAGGQNGFWHFGLGNAAQAELRVIWPDGQASDWQTVAADKFYIVDRNQSVVEFERRLNAE
jgi:hypothetical protein